MSITPPHLQKGDRVAIVCPAKKLPKPMDDAVTLLQSWGLEVVLGQTVTASHNQFAGDDNLRAADLQQYINDDSIKAIFAARGGYGTVRIIDKIDFSRLATHPKWIIGFSDITVLHAHLSRNFGLATIHGQMPINIPDATATSVETLRRALFGEELSYEIEPNPLNRIGEGSGQLIGGNLSILISVLASASDYNYDGKILFIEDVGEYLYSIDRMMYTLKRAGKLKNLAGLIVGGFTDLKDNDIPFGQTAQEIIKAIVEEYDYPVCFGFPAGHVSDNHAILLGKTVWLQVASNEVSVKYK
ncbi:S66 peptidase family protein [Mucilaginibacter terrae]|uniref:Muramoyltetrapeptide carboxypeptidase n=1 Tax=Mucilaginibacter terrae TaxID=1955052 RepID=A0ABU3GU10_9SPHI|nr:LD-carboxypeptidase [Mucilaginibacter terrae]MDT3403257.1 muramoyltetrapeptide carboxypeptidase [Mucilaginibacter terrae]